MFKRKGGVASLNEHQASLQKQFRDEMTQEITVKFDRTDDEHRIIRNHGQKGKKVESIGWFVVPCLK